MKQGKERHTRRGLNYECTYYNYCKRNTFFAFPYLPFCPLFNAQEKKEKMTQNTAAIDFLTKCRIDLSPDFACISIGKILLAMGFAAGIVLIFTLILIKKGAKNARNTN